jgi:hypothetical protein
MLGIYKYSSVANVQRAPCEVQFNVGSQLKGGPTGMPPAPSKLLLDYNPNMASIEYFPAPVTYNSKKPPIMLRFL